MPDRPTTSPIVWFRTLFVATCATTVIFLLCVVDGFHIADDAFMFGRYADNLLAGEGMSWNPGQGPAYGATAPLYVLMVLPFRLLAPDNVVLALWLSSFFWGMMSLALGWRIVRDVARRRGMVTARMAGWYAVVVMVAMPGLMQHFASGMDTTFAMCWAAVLLLRFQQVAQGGTTRQWLWTGVLAGLSWWVRPSLLIFAWGLPLMLALVGKDGRKQALAGLMAVIGTTLVALLLSWAIMGDPLPLSFYAKNTGLYGEGIAARFAGRGMYWLGLFLLYTWPVWLRRIALLRGEKGDRSRKFILALCFCLAVYVLYQVLWVYPIMGFGARFYFPVFPFLLLLGSAGWGLVDRWVQRRWGLAGLFLVVAVYGAMAVREFRRSDFGREFGVFDVAVAYAKNHNDYWPGLSAVSALPDDLTIATTEVGMPAALNPGKTIVDLAGLNDPALLHGGLDMGQAIHKYAPDIIYLPVGGYTRQLAQFPGLPVYQTQYKVYSQKTLHSPMDVALRKSSPHFQQLDGIFMKLSAQHL